MKNQGDREIGSREIGATLHPTGYWLPPYSHEQERR
jgi:hypothetical protein